MKRVSLSALLLVFGFGMFAQNLDKAKDLLKAAKIPDAKTEIDKVVASDKFSKNSEAWYTKAKIYNAIAADNTLSAQTPDARAQALAAIKKYVELDDKKLIMLQIDQYKPMNEIYQGYFKAGADAYNAGKFADALENFKGAIESSSYMSEKGWITQKLDTTSTLYAGISAEKAGKKDEAAGFYGKIAENKIGGDNMLSLYKWLVNYYEEKKDQTNQDKFSALGKEIYPKDLFWLTTELDAVREKGDKEKLFAKYEEVTNAFPDNHLLMFNYGLELYQYASDTTKGKKPANSAELITKAQEKLNKSLAIKPDYPQASLVLGQISYNAGVDLLAQFKAIKVKTPEDGKKRGELRTAALKKFDEAIPYFEKVDQTLGKQGKLKMEDKNALKDAYDTLITIYEQKSQKDKADMYTTKYNGVDKDHS